MMCRFLNYAIVSVATLLSISAVGADGELEGQSCNCSYGSGSAYSQTQLLRKISSSVVYGSASSLAPSHLGFYDPDKAQIPEAVKSVVKSVVFIAAPGGDVTTVKDMFNGHSIDEVIQKIETTPLSSDFGQGDRDVLLYQLHQCKQRSKDQDCHLYDSISLSTAYVIEDGTRIRTAFHAVSDIGRASVSDPYSQTSDKIKFPVPVFVYDSQGKLVVGPSSSDMPIGEFNRDNLRYNYKESGRMTLPNDDLVEIQFSRKIAQPLKPATEAVKPGDTVYTLGYPHKTEDRKPFHAPDAPGQTLRVSYGKVLPMDDAYRKMGKDPNWTAPDVRAFYQKAMIVTDADGAPGQSGGVTLNAQGEVVGTYTAGFPADGSADPNHVSYSSNDFYKMKTPTE